MLKKPELKDFETSGSMIAPFGGYDYKAYSEALDEYIKTLTSSAKNVNEESDKKKVDPKRPTIRTIPEW